MTLSAGCPEGITVLNGDAATNGGDAAGTDAARRDASDGRGSEDAGPAVGFECQANEQCPDGFCATSTATPYCTRRCAPGPTCPDGFACRVTEMDGAIVGACGPSDGLGLGALCTASTQCTVPLCLQFTGGSEVGYCTDFCAGTACPPGYVCAAFSGPGFSGCALSDDTRDRGPGEVCFAAGQCRTGRCDYDPDVGTGVCR